jgi:type VII secretion integral membrane protein EccD
VVVVAASRRLDLALPERLPLAALLPSIVRQTGAADAVPGQPAAPVPSPGWVLRRVDGATLDPARTLAAQAVRDGEVLYLAPRRADWREPDYDDVVEAIAAGVRRQGPAWSAVATRRAGLAAAAATLLVALVVALSAGPPWRVPAAVLLGTGVALLLAGTLLSRAGGDSMAGAVFAGLAAPYLGFGGLLVLAAPDAALTRLGAPHLLVGAVALLLAGVLGQAGVSDAANVFLATILCGLMAAGGAVLGMTPLDGSQAAAAVLAVLVLLHPALPFLAVRLGKLPMPTIPQTTEDLMRDEALPAQRAVFASAKRADEILAGLVLGVSVASTVCLAILARTGGLAAALLVAVASLALLLRVRAWRTVRLRVPMLVAGAAGVALLLLAAGGGAGPMAALGIVVPALLAVTVLVTGAGLVYSKRPLSPYPGRIADILDVVAVISVVPVAAAVLGLYDGMLDLPIGR